MLDNFLCEIMQQPLPLADNWSQHEWGQSEGQPSHGGTHHIKITASMSLKKNRFSQCVSSLFNSWE